MEHRRQIDAPRPRILVVEDEEATRSLVTWMLTDEGYVVVACPNGQEGLAAAIAERFDLIVLDLVMPVVNGFEFAAQYHALPGTHAPIVVITAYQPAAASAAAATGAVEVVRKPFQIDQLLEVVAAHTGGAVRRA